MDKGCGTYALVMQASSTHEIRVGALGTVVFQPGFYIYVGSAFGPGGLAARLAHHRKVTLKPHWHIDYLRQHARLIEIWCTRDPHKREHEWAQAFSRLPGIAIPQPRFGASDCRCAAHLFFTHSPPTDFWEQQEAFMYWGEAGED